MRGGIKPDGKQPCGTSWPAATALALVIAGLTVAGQSVRVARAKPVRALRYE